MHLIVDCVQQLPPSASKRDILASTNAARWAGFGIHHIEPDFSRCETAENAVARLPEVQGEKLFWLGYIPSQERYQAICTASLDLGLMLPNTPQQHALAMELEQFSGGLSR